MRMASSIRDWAQGRVPRYVEWLREHVAEAGIWVVLLLASWWLTEDFLAGFVLSWCVLLPVRGAYLVLRNMVRRHGREMPDGIRERIRVGKKRNLKAGFVVAAVSIAVLTLILGWPVMSEFGGTDSLAGILGAGGFLLAVFLVVGFLIVREAAEYYWEGPGHFETITRFWHAPIAIRYERISMVKRLDGGGVWIESDDGQHAALAEALDPEACPILFSRLRQMWLDDDPAMERSGLDEEDFFDEESEDDAGDAS